MPQKTDVSGLSCVYLGEYVLDVQSKLVRDREEVCYFWGNEQLDGVISPDDCFVSKNGISCGESAYFETIDT
jgi:hypothetical protein